MTKFYFDAETNGPRFEVKPGDEITPEIVIAGSLLQIIEELRTLNATLKGIGFDQLGFNAAQKLDELVDEFKVARRKL